MVIEIKRAWDSDVTSCRTYKDAAVDAVTRAAYSMSGLALGNYILLINGRVYPWPDPKSYSPGLIESDREKMLEKHIRNCVDIDEAFYGSAD